MLEARLIAGEPRDLAEVADELGWPRQRFERVLGDAIAARPIDWDREEATLTLIPRFSDGPMRRDSASD